MSVPKTRRIRNERYYQRKADGICTYGSVEDCPHPPADGSSLCQAHLDDANDRKARSAQALREERREGGWCAYCGEVKSETYACAGCSIRRGDIPTTNSDNNVDNTNADRWRRETIANPNLKDPTAEGVAGTKTTMRYVGQSRRGTPSAATLDEQDLKQIAAELERARVGLQYAHALPTEIPRAQRKDAVRAALSRLDLAGRFIEDVLDRHNYEP